MAKKICPFFSSRVDHRELHAIICIDRLHGVAEKVDFHVMAVRDLYYSAYCRQAADECPMRTDIRMRLVVHHPGHDAMYQIYEKLLKRERGEAAERG